MGVGNDAELGAAWQRRRSYTAVMEVHKIECVTLDPIEWPDIEPALTPGKPAT